MHELKGAPARANLGESGGGGKKGLQIVCRYAPKTPPDMKALMCSWGFAWGRGPLHITECVWMAWASLLQTAQHHHSVHSNSLVRIIILILLLILLITISGLKRDNIAGIKVRWNIIINSGWWRLIVGFLYVLRHHEEEAMGVFSSRLLYTAIKIDFVNRPIYNLIQVVTSCRRCDF